MDRSISFAFLVIFFGVGEASSQESLRGEEYMSALNRAAKSCESSDCGSVIKNTKLKIGDKEIDAVEVSTPTGKETYFSSRTVVIVGNCKCVDCVSVPATVQCEAY